MSKPIFTQLTKSQFERFNKLPRGLHLGNAMAEMVLKTPPDAPNHRDGYEFPVCFHVPLEVVKVVRGIARGERAEYIRKCLERILSDNGI